MDTATLAASIDPSPAVKGATRGHTVRCEFSVATGDKFQSINLYLTGGPADQGIATIYSGGPPEVTFIGLAQVTAQGVTDGQSQESLGF